MLSELEQEVVDAHKEWGFGAYLQWAWLEYPELQEEIGRGEYPELSRLKKVYDKMSSSKRGFDFCYLHSLPLAEINPLQIEQEAWRLLSSKVEQHLDRFNVSIKGYSPREREGEQLLVHLNCGWELLQDWQIISHSYKAKYEKYWKAIPEREEATRQLIQELSSRKPQS